MTIRIGKPCDDCILKRVLCTHVSIAADSGLSDKKRELFACFYEDDMETYMREYQSETCDDSRVLFHPDWLLKLASSEPEPIPELMDMLLVSIDPAGGGKCEWGLCATYYDTVKRTQVIVMLDGERVDDPYPHIIQSWFYNAIVKLRSLHQKFQDIPIIIACESAPHNTGETLAESIQRLINSGKLQKVYMMHETSTGRPGVPKTNYNTVDMTTYSSLLFSQSKVRFSKVFDTSVVGKDALDMKVLFYSQAGRFKRRPISKKDGIVKYRIDGKAGGGQMDDVFAAYNMNFYWYLVFMSSTNTLYKQIRDLSSHWRGSHVTLDTFVVPKPDKRDIAEVLPNKYLDPEFDSVDNIQANLKKQCPGLSGLRL